LSPKVMTLKES